MTIYIIYVYVIRKKVYIYIIIDMYTGYIVVINPVIDRGLAPCTMSLGHTCYFFFNFFDIQEHHHHHTSC